MNEKILCAAVWYKELDVKNHDIPSNTYLPINVDNGVVFTGHRHGQCIYTKCALTGLRDAESGSYIQGFLTTKNRFVDRCEAFDIAMRENQIINLNNTRVNRLYSEDLY